MLVGMETLHATVLYLPCLPSLEQFGISDGVRRGETERSQDIKYDLTGLSSPMHPLSNRIILTHAHPCLTSPHRKQRPGYHVYIKPARFAMLVPSRVVQDRGFLHQYFV